MEIYMIYKEQYSNQMTNTVEKLTPVEFCATEKEALSYSKLFNLQIPLDLRKKLHYKYMYAIVAK